MATLKTISFPYFSLVSISDLQFLTYKAKPDGWEDSTKMTEQSKEKAILVHCQLRVKS